MAACGSLHHIFENHIPESPSSLIETLSSSWKKIKPLKPPVDHSFTELFGELHFKEHPESITPSPSVSSNSTSSFSSLASSFSAPSSFPIDLLSQGNNNDGQNEENKWSSSHKRSESFSSSMNSESLQMCTEGLGFESMDNVEDLKIEFHDTWLNRDNENNEDDRNSGSYSARMRHKMFVRGHTADYYKKGRNNGRTFPPPISSIGRTGRPGVSFQSYRQDGRFVLKEIRIPTQECLHASREDGRLRLRFVQSSDDDDDDDNNAIEEDVAVEESEDEEEETDEIMNEDDEEENKGLGKEDDQEEKENKPMDDFERGDS